MNKKIIMAIALFYSVVISQQINATGWWDLLFNNDRPSHTTYGQVSQASSSTMSDSQMRSYVRQVCRAFGYDLTYSEVNDLEQAIIRAVTYDSATYQSGRYGGYIKDKVDQYVCSGILQFIEEYAYSYAYKRVQNNSRARAIAESMRNNGHALIIQSNSLSAAQLGQFVGSALKKAVDYELANTQPSYNKPQHSNPPAHNPEYTQYQTQQSAAAAAAANTAHYGTYPSDECCVCIESFKDVRRIFLKPCGHDICVSCAYAWFFDGKNKTCPHCRAKVSLADLEKVLVSQ